MELERLANWHPVARLMAINRIRKAAEEGLAALFDAAELEQVRAARSMRNPSVPWKEIGDAVGVTGQRAQRRYEKALKELLGERGR